MLDNKNMDFVLSDETINSYGLIIENMGLQMRDSLPMLFNHDPNRLIGAWDNVRKDNNQTIAKARFDEMDPDAMKLKNKVEQGFLKGVSVGINILKFKMPYNEEDPIRVTAAEVFEASLTAIPSNRNALKLIYKNKEFIMGKNTTKKDLSIFLNGDSKETLETLKEITEEAKAQESVVEEKVEIVEPIQEVATVTEVEPIQETKKEEEVVTVTDESMKLSILSSELELKENVIITLTNEINSLKQVLASYKRKDIEKEVELAIKEGKFSIEQKDTLIKLSEKDNTLFCELVKNAKQVLKAPVALTELLTITKEEDRSNWNLMDWLKKDGAGLENMKLNNPDKYSHLYNERYGNKNFKK